MTSFGVIPIGGSAGLSTNESTQFCHRWACFSVSSCTARVMSYAWVMASAIHDLLLCRGDCPALCARSGPTNVPTMAGTQPQRGRTVEHLLRKYKGLWGERGGRQGGRHMYKTPLMDNS